MEKRIKGFEDYAITDEGKVISYKYKEPRVMKTWLQKSGYENIKLSKDNKTYHFLIHRLVAEAFIPNPNNYEEVDHKNCNRSDNRVENLQWMNHKQNIHKSYEDSGVGAVRNFVKCFLVEEKTEEVIKEFQSKTDASNYAVEHFGCSKSSLMKYGHSKGYKLVKCRD